MQRRLVETLPLGPERASELEIKLAGGSTGQRKAQTSWSDHSLQ